MIGAAVLAATLSAATAAAEVPSGDRLEVRLAEVRERLEGRRALLRSLQARVDALAAEIEALGGQSDKAAAVLRSEREQARALEQQLDRLVPRLLARMAEVNERRARAAGALAELARKSQSPRLDPRIRARLLALSPLMLERLRTLEHGGVSLRGRPDGIIARHARVERRLPALIGAQQRLRHERAQRSRLRQMASDRLRELEVEVRLLGEERAQLARGFGRDDAAIVARAEARSDQRALPNLADTRRAPVWVAAIDGGSLDPVGPAAGVADARNRAGARVVAETPGPDAAVDAAEPGVNAAWPSRVVEPPVETVIADATLRPIEAHAEARRSAAPPAWRSGSRDGGHHAASAATALDMLVSRHGGPSGQDAGWGHAPRSRPPLLPLPDDSLDRALVAHGAPELTIPAAPGQAVAAPVEGRVVFAGRFKSYGLLLILEHEGEYHTLLWGFARLDVHHGDGVEVGQIVGIMDARGDDPPVLHVERRRNGRPVDIAASSNGIQG